MKEFSVEEKAKRYDEAIKVARSKIKNDKDHVLYEKDITDIFHELKDSEDEGIRKEMLDYCYKRMNNEFSSITIHQVERWIPWLEKQASNVDNANKEYWRGYREGKQEILDKYAELEKQGEHQKFPDYIQVGDKVTKDDVLVNLSRLNRVAKREEPTYTKEDVDAAYLEGLRDAKSTEINEDPCIDCDQRAMNCHNFPCDRKKAFNGQKSAVCIPKFHVGDMIIHKELGGDYIHTPHKIIQVDILDKKYRLEGGLIARFGEQDDYELVEQKPAWSEEDETLLDALIRRLEGEDIHVSPHLAVECLKSLKDRVGCEENCTTTKEWSEEDESMLTRCIGILGKCYMGELPTKVEEELNWLKSLEPQKKWKLNTLPHWKKSTLHGDKVTGFNSDYFCYNGYHINYKELFEKLPKDN